MLLAAGGRPLSTAVTGQTAVEGAESPAGPVTPGHTELPAALPRQGAATSLQQQPQQKSACLQIFLKESHEWVMQVNMNRDNSKVYPNIKLTF